MLLEIWVVKLSFLVDRAVKVTGGALWDVVSKGGPSFSINSYSYEGVSYLGTKLFSALAHTVKAHSVIAFAFISPNKWSERSSVPEVNAPSLPCLQAGR